MSSLWKTGGHFPSFLFLKLNNPHFTRIILPSFPPIFIVFQQFKVLIGRDHREGLVQLGKLRHGRETVGSGWLSDCDRAGSPPGGPANGPASLISASQLSRVSYKLALDSSPVSLTKIKNWQPWNPAFPSWRLICFGTAFFVCLFSS